MSMLTTVRDLCADVSAAFEQRHVIYPAHSSSRALCSKGSQRSGIVGSACMHILRTLLAAARCVRTVIVSERPISSPYAADVALRVSPRSPLTSDNTIGRSADLFTPVHGARRTRHRVLYKAEEDRIVAICSVGAGEMLLDRRLTSRMSRAQGTVTWWLLLLRPPRACFHAGHDSRRLIVSLAILCFTFPARILNATHSPTPLNLITLHALHLPPSRARWRVFLAPASQSPERSYLILTPHAAPRQECKLGPLLRDFEADTSL